MRIPVLLALSVLMPIAHADTVRGFCERDGKRLDFTDGIAFADARDENGTLTTTIYLTANMLDRAALAKCADCVKPLPENTALSPRGDLIEAQRSATAKGWMEIQHVGVCMIVCIQSTNATALSMADDHSQSISS